MRQDFTAIEIQRMVMIMDMNGYEQDGDGLTFVHVSGDREMMKFNEWQDVLEFVLRRFFDSCKNDEVIFDALWRIKTHRSSSR